MRYSIDGMAVGSKGARRMFEFPRNFDSKGNQWRFNGVIQEHRKRAEHCGENRDLQRDVRLPALHERNPYGEVMK